MRLTRRGPIVVRLAVVIAFLTLFVALILAWEGGQDRQCEWYRKYEPQQAKAYCGP